MFSAVPGLYLVLDREFKIVTASDAYCRATMTQLERISGRSVFDVFPDNPDDPAADGVRNLRNSLERVLKLGRPDAMAVQKYDIRKPDGSFEVRYWSPLNTPGIDPDGAVNWIVHRAEDVTDLIRLRTHGEALDQIARDQTLVIENLRNANQELDEALKKNARLQVDRNYLADIVASSNDAIIGRAADGRIASWNKAAAEMFGYRPGEIIGLPSTVLAPERLRSEAEQILQRLKSGELVVHYETTRVRKDGTEIFVSITTSPVLSSDGEIIGTSAIMRDITEQKRSEEKLKGLQAELIHLSRWNTMGMMASTLAHELNQPLTATMNYVRAARRLITSDASSFDRAAAFLDKAADETKLAGGIIRSLREFIEKRETTRESEDLNKTVEEALALSLAHGPDSTFRPQLVLEPSLPAVMIDKIQIEQVLLNLIRNALDAMQEMSQRSLIIRTARDEPGFVRVSVADIGPGISPDVMSRLFQPFVTTKERGMGIGLTVCQSIIESHGGRIWTEPNRPRGTIFYFRLPIFADGAG